jgi:DNA polymerase-3 subunit gamma/tau
LIEQFAGAEGRMKWAANKKMHFEIAAIRAIQTLRQATLTEVLDALTAMREGTPLPARPEVPKSAPAKTPPPAGSAPAAAPVVAEKARRSKTGETAKSLPAATTAPRMEECGSPAPGTPIGPKVSEEPGAPAAADPAVSSEEIWPRLIARVRKERPLISEWVESGALLEITNGVVVLGFPREATLAREACERANNRTFVEKILSELAGSSLQLKCELRDGLVVERIAREEPRVEPAIDPMEKFKNDPLIQKALAEFKAEILPA